MQEDDPNVTCVASWIERAAGGLSSDELVQLFDLALAALWKRSYRPLGDVTVAAIMDRVAHDATERFPLIAGLQVEASRVSCVDLHRRAAGMSDGDGAALREGIRFMLVEFLTILGNLTADIFTPALRDALSVVVLGTARPASPAGTKRAPRKRTR